MRKTEILLLLCAVAMTAACFMSIYIPIHFEKERTARENVVKKRLIQIRDAEERYRKATGTYTADFTVLTDRGFIADSLQYIPFTGGRRFRIVTGLHTTENGREIPIMECSTTYSEYLSGLNKNAIAGITREAEEIGDYPGLKIGDMTIPNNNNGNWE